MLPDGKYIASLTAAMTAADSGSGVSLTTYRLNRSGPWITYTSPFTIYAATTHPLEFYSIDNAGNQELSWVMDCNKGTLTQT
ncbi:OmpL47-type beta-barrel domain-containing protein [Paenibacillus allorhizosphaerae]|uniref:OmpL47-type beta-barrel domain-containing protein n=1 Tax=Paenibacillus allorhizosphaerae TaxID=2849866 RepID=UPI001C4023AC|nr:hypothetical protein [Paenibacillus allorhizosphaerae]